MDPVNKDVYVSRTFRNFFEKSNTAMALADEKGIIIFFNKEFTNILESLSIAGPDVRNMPIQEMLSFNIFPHFSGAFSHLINGQARHALFSIPFKSSDDAIHWLKIRAWLINNGALPGAGSRKFYIGIVLEDHTKERKEEEQLQEDRRIAQRAMEAKSQFLANMSHEIRTPIQTIIGMTELLQDTKLDREQAEYSRQVKFSAEVLLSLINDILDYSKIEAGRMELEHTDFDLEQTIVQAVEMISMEAHKKGLELILDIPPDVDIMASGDPHKFRQVVINLVKNAVKFTKSGSVITSARMTAFNAQEAVLVAVADTGIGIAGDLQQQLFTTFFQGDPSNTRRFGGTGLGLAISKNLVELMGGKIEMRSNEGGGSVFSFTVPVHRSKNAKPEPLQCTAKDEYVLVVDDHSGANKVISAYLADIGYRNIRQAGSGDEALGIMRKYVSAGKPFSLCLIDMVMPQMDGWRLAAEIKNDPLINTAKLILMVPHGLLGADAKMTLLKWFDGYVYKPLERCSLLEVIELVNDDSIAELEAVDTESNGYRDEAEVPVPCAGTEAVPDPGNRGNGKPLLMIVEDHPVNQKLFSVIMEKIGYSAILADDGQDAIEKIANAPGIALIFMDIQMPRMNGYEATRKLREMGFRIPIIAVTASALSDERERCMQVGFNDILVKPFKKPDIERMLYKWIGAGIEILNNNVKGNGAPGAAREKEKEQPMPDSEIFNKKDVLETFMGNEEVIKPLIAKFIERTEDQVAAISENIRKRDWENGRRNAHTIKGSALTLSAKKLGGSAAQLELAFKEKDEPGIEKLYPLLKEAFERFKKETADYITGI